MTTAARAIGLGAALALLLSACTAGDRGAGAGGDPAAYGRLGADDVELAARSFQDALETARDGETRAWRNHGSGNGGAFTPIRTYVTEGGYFCREYREALAVDGDKATFTHDACRDEAGRWVWL